jgi:hypothetical protein
VVSYASSSTSPSRWLRTRADRDRSARRDHNGLAAGPRRQGGSTQPVQHRPGAPGRQQAYCSGEAGIQTCPAQRGNQGLQPDPERPGTHNQGRTGRRSSAPGHAQQRRGLILIPHRRLCSGPPSTSNAMLCGAFLRGRKRAARVLLTPSGCPNRPRSETSRNAASGSRAPLPTAVRRAPEPRAAGAARRSTVKCRADRRVTSGAVPSNNCCGNPTVQPAHR